MQVTVVITGDKEVRNKINRLGKSLYHLKDAMNEIGREGTKYYSSVAFASQGGVFGAKWPALSPRYAARKARQYPGRGILVRSGGQDSMQNSFTYKATNTSVEMGNDAKQFVYHQSSAPRKVIPRRRMIGVNEPIKRIIRSAISNDISKKIRSA